jgi:hypothetical protein
MEPSKSSFSRTIRYLNEQQLVKDGGVIKKVISRGVAYGEDSMPLPGQKVFLRYEARLENGIIVDRSADYATKGEDFSLVVGMGQVIDGWDMGMMSMHLGEKSDIFI